MPDPDTPSDAQPAVNADDASAAGRETGAPGPASAPPPVDPRPQPRYGELAPPGWSWQPPAPAPAEPAQAPAPAAPPAPTAVPRRAPAPRWDRILTIGLVVFGLFGLWQNVSVLANVTQVLALYYEQQGLGAYTPSPEVPGLANAGIVVQVVLWFVAAALSSWRLVRGRLAFWVPLTVGVTAFLVLIGFMVAILLTDPSLITQLEKQAG